MSETHLACDRFEGWLLEGGTEVDRRGWRVHLDGCTACREQWHAHQVLAVTFAEEAVPELSPAFEPVLDRMLVPEVESRPLAGWRQVAMLTYVATALGLLVWTLKDVTLPPIDLSAPWIPVATLIAVPLSFLVAIAASRWLPGRAMSRGPRLFAL
ncbi:MAG: hypothetical protein CL477_08945 [Acidobacteria bacterium]|jgi:hypothetical protein|nr:hypothetical protein [Acidobacteriota bacterium]|tara:strand:- start:1269 stop:1733 length:465 start_codon:yes stop_codon:yes gene_type:complete